MSSLLTNSAALTALQNLSQTQKSLQQVQNQISTGLRVSNASDNAAYWSIATTMKSDNGALSSVKDALTESSSMIDVASAALDSTLSVVNSIKNSLVSASQPGADLAKIQTDISTLQQQLLSSVKSAAFNGQNWLDGSSSSVKLVAAFNRDSTGATSIDTIDFTTQALTNKGQGILDGAATTSGGAATTTDLTKLDVTSNSFNAATAIADTDKIISKLTDYSSVLGATKSRVNLQTTFVGQLSDAYTNGISSLVDADMNQASTRLQALQTQQQLGVQAISIANQNTQMILKLFQ
jgi:flagellin